MRRLVLVPVLAAALVVAFASTAWAGSPHFIQSATTASVSGSTLTVEGKEAGLGDEAQIHVVLSATALCINGGGNHPKAVNKESVNAAADFPVQNGKADWTLSVAAVFQPSCNPPMTVAFTDITVTDTTNGLTLNIPGTF
jgi:predicted metal-binding membrane protein